MKEIDPEALAQCDGKEGKPVYIAHGERVIDVSESKLWKGGVHMARHHAGMDLTTDIQAAPHGLEVLDRYPQVAMLKKPAAGTPQQSLPPFVSRLLEQYPMIRRHPHPMTVHFPIVFMISTTMFSLLYVLTGLRAFETTALNCLGAGILMAPVAIVTGLATWWLNYLGRPSRHVTIKRSLSIVLLCVAIAAFVWRLMVPNVLDHLGGAGGLYLMLVLSLTPIVLIIAYHGGQLTFPVEKKEG